MMNISELDLEALILFWLTSERNPALRNVIENELVVRIQNNNNFSREYLFRISSIQNHALGIQFIPTSDSFNRYGQHITLSILLNDNEKAEMISNYSSGTNTFGNIKAKWLTGELADEQKYQLETIGFNTNEIATVMHL